MKKYWNGLWMEKELLLLYKDEGYWKISVFISIVIDSRGKNLGVPGIYCTLQWKIVARMIQSKDVGKYEVDNLDEIKLLPFQYSSQANSDLLKYPHYLSKNGQ